MGENKQEENGLAKQNGLIRKMYGDCLHCKQEVRVLRKADDWVCSICFQVADNVKEYKPDEKSS